MCSSYFLMFYFIDETIIIIINGEKYFLAIQMVTKEQDQLHAGKICVSLKMICGAWWAFFSLVLGSDHSCALFIVYRFVNLRWLTLGGDG